MHETTYVRRPLWRRFLKWLAITIPILVVGFLVQHYWSIQLAQKELDEVVAQLDRDDPGWRLEDIEAKRKVIPDAENGALVVTPIAPAAVQ